MIALFTAAAGILLGFGAGYLAHKLEKDRTKPEPPRKYPMPPGTQARVKQRDDGNAELLVALRPDGITYIATKVTDPETGEVCSNHLLLRPGTMTQINQMLIDCMDDMMVYKLEQMRGERDAPLQVEEPEIHETR